MEKKKAIFEFPQKSFNFSCKWRKRRQKLCQWMQGFSGDSLRFANNHSLSQEDAKVVPMNAKFLSWTQKLCQQLQTFSGEHMIYMNKSKVFQENAKVVRINAKIFRRMQKMWQWMQSFSRMQKLCKPRQNILGECKNCVNECKISRENE